MDITEFARIITLLVLIGVFVAAVLITPRIWRANPPRASAGTVKASDSAPASTERGEEGRKEGGATRT